MSDHDRLYNLILEHWSRYHPSMLAQLRRENLLQQRLEQTAEQFSEFLYQMISVQKMEYHRAWELAIDQFLLPEEPSLTSNPSRKPPAISE